MQCHSQSLSVWNVSFCIVEVACVHNSTLGVVNCVVDAKAECNA